MIVKGVFTQGKHVGKSISSPDVSAAYLRMVMWHGDFGSHVDDVIKAELTRRGEVHFDAKYNQAYRSERRQQAMRERVYEAFQEKIGGAARSQGTPQPKNTSAPTLSQSQLGMIEVINAGRQALAKRHHPDVGGDAEKMKQVNQAADALVTMVRGKQ